ncbi:MAG: factor-independent urate hydroxylase [Bryobacteraceae bacterium]
MILAENSYGESRVRLVKVTRQPDRHDLKEIGVDIYFEGGFEAVYKDGDNSGVLPADTLKNTVYALASQTGMETIEEFGLRLAGHFMSNNPGLSRVRVDLAEHTWEHMPAGGRPQRSAFLQAGQEKHIARIQALRDGVKAESGIEDLIVMKTSGSAFAGYKKDEYTTLAETQDRLFRTAIRARWNYTSPDISYGPAWHGIRQMILDTFAEHDSKSVQHTLYAIGENVLEQCEEIDEIHLSLPNKRCLPVDLGRFGLANHNEIFVPVDEPAELIEATLKKSATWTSSSAGSQTRRLRLRLR